MKNRAVSAFVVSGLVLASHAPSAWATCGSTSCFCVTDTGDGAPGARGFRVDLSIRGVDQDRKRSGTGSTSEVPTPKIDFESGTIVPNHHREESTRSTVAQLDVEISKTFLGVFYDGHVVVLDLRLVARKE